MSDSGKTAQPANAGPVSGGDGGRSCTSMLYVTCGSVNEARMIARTMVDERLIACANMFGGMQSIYRWQDKVVEDDEVVLLLKTSADRVDGVIARVRELHSYDVPCVVELPLARGNESYLDWIVAEASGSGA